MSKRLTAVAAAVLASTLPGCSGTDSKPRSAGAGGGEDSARAAGLPCGRLEPKKSNPDRPVVAEFPTGRPTGYIALWGHYLGYTPDNTSAVVCDLHTGHVDTILRASTAQAQVSWIKGSGDTAVVVELDSTPSLSDGGDETGWRIFAVDLATKKSRTIANAGRTPYGALPKPAVDGNRAAWLEASDSGAQNVVAYDLVANVRRVVVPDVHAASVSVSGANLFYNAEVAPGRLDLFRVPADGSGKPVKLNTEGDVSTPSIRQGLATWQKFRPRTPAAEDDQFDLVTWREDKGTIAQLGRGVEPVSSGSIVVWYSNTEGLLAGLAATGASPVRLAAAESVYFGGRWDAVDDLVAWVGVDDALSAAPKRAIRFARLGR